MLKSVMTMIYCIGILAYKSRNFGQKMNLRNLSNSTYTRAIKQDDSRLRFLKSINNLSNTIYQIKRAVFLVFMVGGLDALKYLIENNTYRCWNQYWRWFNLCCKLLGNESLEAVTYLLRRKILTSKPRTMKETCIRLGQIIRS
jgi:hypothetical protein